jgi:hypothetical protein
MVQKMIMVPETYVETQAVTVQKPVGVVQNRQRTIQKVIEGQKIIESQQILQYERPRVQVIPGRMLGAQQMGVQQVGVQWNRAYYDQQAQGVQPGMVVNQAVLNPSQYNVQYQGIQQGAGYGVGGNQLMFGGGAGAGNLVVGGPPVPGGPTIGGGGVFPAGAYPGSPGLGPRAY